MLVLAFISSTLLSKLLNSAWPSSAAAAAARCCSTGRSQLAQTLTRAVSELGLNYMQLPAELAAFLFPEQKIVLAYECPLRKSRNTGSRADSASPSADDVLQLIFSKLECMTFFLNVLASLTGISEIIELHN